MSVNIPTSDILLTVLGQSVEFPEDFIDELQSELRKNNPFSSTKNIVLTEPKDLVKTRSAKTRSTSVFGIAGAGAVMVMTLAIFAGAIRRRNDYSTDDDNYSKTFNKQDCCDTTVAGETFVSESSDSTYDGAMSMLSSPSVVENNDVPKIESSEGTNKERNDKKSVSERTGNKIRGGPPRRKPRTVAEIETLLSLGYYEEGGVI